MKYWSFYTIMLNGKFVPEFSIELTTDNFSECIRCNSEEEINKHFKVLRKDINFKKVKVEFTVCDD